MCSPGPPWAQEFAGMADRTREILIYIQLIIRILQRLHLDGEVHWARSGRILSTGASVPHGVAMCQPPSLWMCLPTWELSESRNLGIFFFNGGFIAWLIINSVSSPCLFPGDWGRAGSFKLLVMLCLSGGQCLYCPGVHQELPPYNQRLCYLPGSSQQYRNFCVRPTSPPSVRRCCRGF